VHAREGHAVAVALHAIDITARLQSQRLLFITVPDGKTVKNRVHLDLRPVDRTRDQETERILALGASLQADHRRPDGSGWVTLADPEGNEFCICPWNLRAPELRLDSRASHIALRLLER
jgi:hypothetical protein